jgi:hypothetical protein
MVLNLLDKNLLGTNQQAQHITCSARRRNRRLNDNGVPESNDGGLGGIVSVVSPKIRRDSNIITKQLLYSHTFDDDENPGWYKNTVVSASNTGPSTPSSLLWKHGANSGEAHRLNEGNSRDSTCVNQSEEKATVHSENMVA